MRLEEIVLPETDPETEWVRGRALRKVSPTRDHGRVQLRIATALDAWAGKRGDVATEWRFRLAPDGEVRRPLVPDVAFVRAERLNARSHADIQVPDIPPDVVVEVLSPDDDPRDVAEKVDVYLRSGVALVVAIDPRRRVFTAHDAGSVCDVGAGGVFEHAALPGFSLDVTTFFARALDR